MTSDMTKDVIRLRAERDRAVGAVLLLAFDGVISQGRARELLGMDVHQQRAEYRRIHNDMNQAPRGKK